jgi:hypothetical protein
MKPYVISHMNASVDGRILGSRWRPAENRMAGLFERLHEQLGGGSWLIGRVTGSEYAKAASYPDPIAPTVPIRGNPGSPGGMPPLTASRSMRGARSPGDDPTSAATRSSRY